MAREWWRDAVVYQVYPRSFCDGNSDGEGDLIGVRKRLPYLAALGVDALWLSPFYPSPMADAGYDVSNPRAVDPRYGTLDDAQELFDEAHKRGIKVLVDVVPNHVSVEHVWFQEALSAEPGSAARARFHFRDGRGPNGDEPPNNWVSMFTGTAWTRVTEPDGRPGQWYLHLFDSSQPDLNWSNPEILEDSLQTLKFWLDLGVDGFRVDVALGLAKDMSYADDLDPVGLVEGLRLDLSDGSRESEERRRRVPNSCVFDRDEVQDYYRAWRRLMDSYDRETMAVAEAWVQPERAVRYIAGDTLHQIFNFDFLVTPWDATAIRRTIEATVAPLQPIGASPTWALCNHDTPRVATRLGGGPQGLRRARALALITQGLPGAVYVFGGEELGLEDVELADHERQDPVFLRSHGTQKGRDGGRVPLPWSGESPPYGFSDHPVSTWLPQPSDWKNHTAQAQLADMSSTLRLYQDSLRIRHAHRGLAGCDELVMLDAPPGVVAYQRGAGFLCVANVSDEAASFPVPESAQLLLSAGEAGIDAERSVLRVASDSCAWVQV